MKLSCDIVKDLLPLYVEDMISGSSAEAVREHLEACPACSRERETLENAAKETVVDEAESQKAPLMLLKKRLRLERVLSVLCGCALAACVLTAVFAYQTAMRAVDYDDDLFEITETEEGFVLADLDEEATNFTSQYYDKDGKRVREILAWHSNWDLLSGQRRQHEVTFTEGLGTVNDDGETENEVLQEAFYQCDELLSWPGPKTDTVYYRNMATGQLTLIYGEGFDGDTELLEEGKLQGRMELDRHVKLASACAAALLLLWLVFRRTKLGVLFRYLCLIPSAYLASAFLSDGGLYPSHSYCPDQEQLMICWQAAPILAFFVFCMLAYAWVRLKRD